MISGNIAARLACKNWAPFITCITIDDAEDLDQIIPIHNLVEHSSSYHETRGTLWFYSKDETTNFNADIDGNNDFKSFKRKT